MKKIIISFCFASCLILGYCYYNQENFILMEYKPQSAYVVAKKDNTKQETKDIFYSLKKDDFLRIRG